MEQKYVMAAIDAALKAGGKILSIYNDLASDFEIERKADNSPLTIADRKAHEAIVAILNDTPFPVLSEEGKHLGYEIRRGWDTSITAARAIACPAAVSHSIVGAKRGYTSALPSATRQILIELPLEINSTLPCFFFKSAIYDSVSLRRWSGIRLPGMR